jgi:predicted Zn-dependent protease
VIKIQDAVTAASAKGGTATNPAEYERVIDRIVYGDSREKGMVRGGEFVHPVLRFLLRFPDGWEIVNGADQVSATESEQGNVVMLLELSPDKSGSPEQAARADMSQAGLRELDGRSSRINGLDAYVATYEGVVQQTRVLFRAAHIRSGQQMYIVGGLTSATEFPRADRLFSASIQSFRQLTVQEADRIQPSRIIFYTARSGDSWESIAKQGGSGIRPTTLAIMNGSDPGTPPRAGARLRVVGGG